MAAGGIGGVLEPRQRDSIRALFEDRVRPRVCEAPLRVIAPPQVEAVDERFARIALLVRQGSAGGIAQLGGTGGCMRERRAEAERQDRCPRRPRRGQWWSPIAGFTQSGRRERPLRPSGDVKQQPTRAYSSRRSMLNLRAFGGSIIRRCPAHQCAAWSRNARWRLIRFRRCDGSVPDETVNVRIANRDVRRPDSTTRSNRRRSSDL
jgi:hypothetical protein